MHKLPLPPRPNLEHYKKRAKELAAAANSKDDGAIRIWAISWLEAIARPLIGTITPPYQEVFDKTVEAIDKLVRNQVAMSKSGRFKIADAQFFIAKAHGFNNWSELANELKQITRMDPETGRFEAAVDAVISGDITTLEPLLTAHPELIGRRSTRKHQATLLHYVAANGVEDYRQKTPPNAVAVARLLLERGAEVDALANTYGGDKYQTTMNLLVSSVHPAGAGLQPPLVEALLDFGAAINGLENDGSPLMTALRFGYGDAAETLARRGARIDNVVAAAALGQLGLVRSFVLGKVTLRPDVPFINVSWLRMPRDAKAHIELAFVWACKFKRTAVAEFFLETGVDPTVTDMDKMTPLHWAAANGMMDLIDRFLEQGVPLEVENAWGGTVLDSTVHFALYQPVVAVNYPAVLERLIAAGANLGILGPDLTGNKDIDNLRRRHGALPR
jgi:ankyrin repeat protein